MSDSGEDDNIPAREVCEQRCSDFAQVTGTDSALAMFYLQDRNWDLERALNAFFEELGGAACPPNNLSNTHPTSSSTSVTAESVVLEETDGPMPRNNRLQLMSWNIDGLDVDSVVPRTKGVCQTINREKPDVVFLQEVVRTSEDLLEKLCTDYMIVPGNSDETDDYYTAIMLKINSTAFCNRQVIPFPTSVMMRNLLVVKVQIRGMPFKLMTSHLESTSDHAAERKNQLNICLKELRESKEEETAIFGGDLNLRDKELAAVGGLPDSVVDLWEATGKRPEAQYTWDMTRNDNLRNWSAKFRPRCRFDRLYMKGSKPESGVTSKCIVEPVYFELVGLERLKTCGRYPSDHWGLLVHFDKVKFR